MATGLSALNLTPSAFIRCEFFVDVIHHESPMTHTRAVGIQRNIVAARVDIFHQFNVMARERDGLARHSQLCHLEMGILKGNQLIGIFVGLFLGAYVLQA